MAGTERTAAQVSPHLAWGRTEGITALLRPRNKLRQYESEFVEDIRKEIGVFQRGMPTALGERGRLPDEFRDAFYNLTYTLPPMPAEMTESYTMLQNELTKPWENGDKTDTLFSRTLRAYLIAGSMLYQTALPADKKELYVHAPDDTWRRGIKAIVEASYRIFPSNAGSLEARTSLTGEMDSYLRFVEAHSKRDATTPEQTMHQAIHVNTLLEREDVDRLMYFFIDPKVKDKLLSIHSNILGSVAQNPFSTQLLLEHKYDDFYAEIRGETFVQTMWRELEQPGGPDKSTVGQLHDFYFGDAPLREYFWRRVNKDTKHHEEITDLFLKNDAATARRFVEVSMIDVTTAPDGTKKDDKRGQIQNFLGIVADFQARNPEHENLGAIHESVEEAAKGLDAQHIVQPMISILKGDATGLIYLNENGEACTKIFRDGDVWEKLERQMEALDPQNRVVFVSSRPEAVVTAVAETVLEPAVPVVLAKPEATEPAKLPLFIPAGEVASDSRWTDAQYLSNEQIGPLGEHFHNRLEFGDREEGDWLTYVSNGKIDKNSFSQGFPALFPSLLPSGHRFQILDQLGIQSVENINGLITVVINTMQAGINTDGPRRLLVRGRLDNEGIFAVNGDEKNSFDINSRLVITGAVLFAQQHFTNTFELGEEEVARVQDITRSYNEEHMHTGMPKLIAPRSAGEFRVPFPSGSVLVPTGRKKEMIALPLEFLGKS